MELGGGGGGLLAARAGMRMRSRQQYRTMSRMQRRRSYMADRLGARQDFSGRGEAAPEAEAAPAADAPDYTAELEKLAKLRDEGVITAEDFEAKKKQLLGI
jgi:putative oligomerization/nucleic acid binding protein